MSTRKQWSLRAGLLIGILLISYALGHSEGHALEGTLAGLGISILILVVVEVLGNE